MTTVVNNPGPERVVAVDSSAGSAGWGIAVIILLVVIGVGVFLWMQFYRVAPTTQEGLNINVTLPAGEEEPAGDNSAI